VCFRAFSGRSGTDQANGARRRLLFRPASIEGAGFIVRVPRSFDLPVGLLRPARHGTVRDAIQPLEILALPLTERRISGRPSFVGSARVGSGKVIGHYLIPARRKMRKNSHLWPRARHRAGLMVVATCIRIMGQGPGAFLALDEVLGHILHPPRAVWESHRAVRLSTWFQGTLRLKPVAGPDHPIAGERKAIPDTSAQAASNMLRSTTDHHQMARQPPGFAFWVSRRTWNSSSILQPRKTGRPPTFRTIRGWIWETAVGFWPHASMC